MPQPIVKWVGGKRQLLNVLMKQMPENFGTYYEPFFGGGALFFERAPGKAVVNDANPQLMNLYKNVRNCPDDVLDAYEDWRTKYNSSGSGEVKDRVYRDARNQFNKDIKEKACGPENAGTLLFLNRAGYNGVYRVNKKGLFNVPSAHREQIGTHLKSAVYAASQALQGAELRNTDFAEAVQGAKAGDVVYFDPPYYETFTQYQDREFSKEDQVRLAKLFKKLSDNGVTCILSNSDAQFIRNLYSGYAHLPVRTRRSVNRNASKRSGNELIIVSAAQ